MNIDESFKEIYDQTYNKIFSYVVSKCNDISKVEDIIQEIYLKLYSTLQKNSKYIENYESFLVKLAKNELFKHYNIFNVMKSKFVDFASFNIETIENKNFDNELFDEFEIKNIWQAVKKLDLTTQKIFILYYKEELSLNTISDNLKINLSTVKSKIYRGLSKLKKLLKGDNDE